MKRNAVKIVCDPYTNQISYFFKNELGEWMVLTGSSPLSRQHYTKTTMKERHKDIVEKLDEIYNRKNKGLDIFFEGSSMNYEYISGAVRTYLPGRDIVCKAKATKIAVVGKRASGKSTLIEGIANEKKCKFEITKRNQYVQYTDKANNIEWIELSGIDFSVNTASKAALTIQDLAKNGLSTVIYCIPGDSGRIEDTEKRLIEKINSDFPGITVLTVLTRCYKEDVQGTIDEIEKLTNHREVFPVLAKEYYMKAHSVIAPFGIKELCAFVFEGKKLPRQFQNRKENTFERNAAASSVKETKSADIPKRNVAASSVKETKSADIPKKKPEFKKIAVIGKRAAGKTTLIEGIENYIGQPFQKDNRKNYVVYEDRKNHMQWYEVKGIDFGKDKLEEAYEMIKNLLAEGLNTVFYCISAGAGRIEDSEGELIRKLIAECPQASVTIILTMCYKDDIRGMLEAIEKASGQSEIIQTLARDYKTKIRIPKTGEYLKVPSFGLDLVYRRAHEGK